MIPPHLFYQIYIFFLEQNDCTPPKCGELSEYTDSAHTLVEDLSSRYMNGSNVYDQCGHETNARQPGLYGMGGCVEVNGKTILFCYLLKARDVTQW